MSDSDDQNENFCFFGKPLQLYDEDSFPKRRPISVEEQIATDAQGRRRFHGAFTGGFSAGFFNTVGSLEGWLPGEFKSSRQEKAKSHSQKPEDFMDDEDLGEFGIAPQVVKATAEFSTSKKRKKEVFSDGPIPGEPVLHDLLQGGNETVGYLLLKNMGMKDKLKEQEELNRSEQKMYGCEIPKAYEIPFDITNKQYEIQDLYREFLSKPKDNTFGLGYVGLDKSNLNLFVEQKVKTSSKDKRTPITGQAFGVGAFEEEDDDIYVKDDMNKYDFELGEEKQPEKPKKKGEKLIFETFKKAKTPLLKKDFFPPPQIPHSFTGKHKIKRSRFEPLVEDAQTSKEKINPIIRAKYLGEETHTATSLNTKTSSDIKENQTQASRENEKMEVAEPKDYEPQSAYLTDRFISSSEKEDVSNILEPVKKMETIHGTDQMRDAARMKIFGPLTRVTSDWIPCPLLCKRFNVPEPLVNPSDHVRKRTKNLIFEYQKHKEEDISQFKPGLLKETDSSKEETPSNSEVKEDSEIPEMKQEPIEEESPETTEPSEQDLTSENLPKDITDKLDVDKKQDLFRAIFLSSDSESEHDDEDVPSMKEEQSNEDLKSIVLSDQLIPKIKPIKEGILSNMNFRTFNKPQMNEKEVEHKIDQQILRNETDDEEKADLYGPKIPSVLPNASDSKISISSESEDDWIEKDEVREKKSKLKKEKKHKKDKHKKHKHSKKKKHKR